MMAFVQILSMVTMTVLMGMWAVIFVIYHILTNEKFLKYMSDFFKTRLP